MRREISTPRGENEPQSGEGILSAMVCKGGSSEGLKLGHKSFLCQRNTHTGLRHKVRRNSM